MRRLSRARPVVRAPGTSADRVHRSGQRVENFRWARGYQDPHFVEPKPHSCCGSRAPLLSSPGLDLEIGYIIPHCSTRAGTRGSARADPGYIRDSGAARYSSAARRVTRASGGRPPVREPPIYCSIPPRPGDRAGIAARLSQLDPAGRRTYGQLRRSRRASRRARSGGTRRSARSAGRESSLPQLLAELQKRFSSRRGRAASSRAGIPRPGHIGPRNSDAERRSRSTHGALFDERTPRRSPPAPARMSRHPLRGGRESATD